MTLVKPKAATREAWQYTGQPPQEWPAWIAERAYADTTLAGELICILTRRSGKQWVRVTEWLVRNLDGDPEWLTHDQMRKTFDEVVG